MNEEPGDGDGRRPNKRIVWIVAGVLIALLVLVSVQGLVRGSGEAAGITKAAPGDDNATPAAETINSDRM